MNGARRKNGRDHFELGHLCRERQPCKGEDLVPGTMLDLKSMQEAGEEIYNIPVSDEEMKNVVESVYGELPEVE